MTDQQQQPASTLKLSLKRSHDDMLWFKERYKTAAEGKMLGAVDVEALNARSRAILMQKLDGSGTATSITGSLGSPAVNGTGLALPATPVLGVASVVNSLVASLGQTSIPALAGIPGANLPVPPIVPPVDLIGVLSECLLLKNMFDPNIETEPDFDLDIRDDVQDECIKFGVLKHIYVDKNNAGHVYLRFDNTQVCQECTTGTHGRWFAVTPELRRCRIGERFK